MLKLREDTEFVNIDEQAKSSSNTVMSKLTDAVYKISNKAGFSQANYVVISKDVAEEINKFRWDINYKVKVI